MKNINIFKNKTVLITGGTGSFGQKCTSQLLKKKVKKIIIFSRDELKQYEYNNPDWGDEMVFTPLTTRRRPDCYLVMLNLR